MILKSLVIINNMRAEQTRMIFEQQKSAQPKPRTEKRIAPLLRRKHNHESNFKNAKQSMYFYRDKNTDLKLEYSLASQLHYIKISAKKQELIVISGQECVFVLIALKTFQSGNNNLYILKTTDSRNTPLSVAYL